jgi:hypothetical protein
MVASGRLPKILSLALFLTSHVVSSWCSSQKLHQLRDRIAFSWKLFSTRLIKGGAEEDEAPVLRGLTVTLCSKSIIQLFISCTSCKRADISIYLTDSPWGRPVHSSCSSYSVQVCRARTEIINGLFFKPLMVRRR